MSSKIITEKEFNNIWFRRGKDPDGNDMSEITLGGENDSYSKYFLKKQNEEQNSFKNKQNCQIKLKNVNEQPLQTEQLYIWRSMDDDKVRSEHVLRDDETFDWNSDDLRPGEDYGCRCYAEFLDSDGNPNGKYGRIKWPDKETESNPKPYFEPSDKNGIPLNEKPWKELTQDEKELRKQEELEKFKNSDRLRENVKKAEEMKKKFGWTNPDDKLKWFYNQVKSGGPWDYKKDGHPEMEHVGNFNYGTTGKAAGFSDFELKLGAGFYQTISGTSNWSFRDSYFDDPKDMEHIENGIEWYENEYYD